MSMGIEPLAMVSLGVSNSEMTSADPATANYWESRWETYKYFYSTGKWMWHRRVKRFELYNEPDLNTYNSKLYGT